MGMRTAATMSLGLVLSGCFLLKPADPKDAEPAPAPKAKASPTAAFRARYEKIQGASPETAKALHALRTEMLLARTDAAKALGPRMTRQQLIDAEPEERNAYANRRNAFIGRWGDAAKIATSIRYRRGAIFAGEGDALGALREVAWPDRFGRGDEITQACYDEPAACEKAVAAVNEAYGRLGVVQNETAVVNPRTGSKTHVLIDFVATAAQAKGSGWIVKGRKHEPGKVRNCQGRTTTQEIVAVKPKSVTVKETTWCKKISYSLSKGLAVTYQIEDLPFELEEGSLLRVLVQRDQIACRDGMVRQCVVKNTEVISATTKPERAFRGGEAVPLAAAARY